MAAAQVCENIQMLLEAAEFLERRERGRPRRLREEEGGRGARLPPFFAVRRAAGGSVA